MNVLKFTMPPFARLQWVSGNLKDKYEPMFNKAKNLYKETEFLTVLHGLRTTTTASIHPQNMDAFQQNMVQKGLIFLPLRRVGIYNGFSTYHPPVEENKPWNYYGVVSNSIEGAEEFAHAEENTDHRIMGKLLGYPQCCIDSFFENWDKGYTDQVWQQALVGDSSNIRIKENNLIRLKNIDWESNTLLKYFNIGPLFHTKCSITCKHSSIYAKNIIDLAHRLNVDGLQEVEMFSRMPMEWDASKGIAFIRTPLFKAEINSVTCTEPFKVQLEGTYFPDDSGKSIEFPWSERWTTQARNGNKLTFSEGDIIK
jgi:hypothetical protein